MSPRPVVQAVVIGCSAGGIAALHHILPRLPADLPVPVIVVCHTGPSPTDLFSSVLRRDCRLPVMEAPERGTARPGHIYVAPADYHLLMEEDKTFALSADPRVNNARPAIDLLFESAANVWGEGLLAVQLTGANDDGAAGMKEVKAAGGLCLVQDPATATATAMPEAAIATGAADWVAPLDWIAFLITSLCFSSAPAQDCRP